MEKYFFEAFDGLDRLGPGSKVSTLKAISMVCSSKEQIKILDIGCGNGIHTKLLAQEFPDALISKRTIKDAWNNNGDIDMISL